MTTTPATGYDLPDELLVSSDGPVRIVTLNRPQQRNGVNRALHQSLARVWDLLGRDAGARAVVLTARGDFFSAGGDFDYMQENVDDAQMRAQTIDEARAIITGMIRCPLPVVAAVNGPAVGLGASLAVLADLAVLSDRSFLADPHLRMGLAPGDGGMTWPALIGLGRAKEFLFLGGRITPEKAVELGLASRVVAHDDLMQQSVELAYRLAGVPADALQSTKLALNSYLDVQLDRAYESALQAELRSMHSPEHRDAVAAARAKS